MRKKIQRLGLLAMIGISLGCAEPGNPTVAKNSAPSGQPNPATTESKPKEMIPVAAPTAENNPVIDEANLEIGKVAPEIIGSDFDGVEFKLSDYRGKVVVLDFWGDW
ncbi:MAG: redoxin domain-containing protein [Planctomycetaceae bacterium]|mgnify:CR=1 FL=1|jgi:hypothetical protein|nr:redoxin domain-containing protein [Planctomycetaceae bacterium]